MYLFSVRHLIHCSWNYRQPPEKKIPTAVILWYGMSILIVKIFDIYKYIVNIVILLF